MSSPGTATWQELLAAGPDEPKVAVTWRVLCRGGQPFLYLPTHNRAAVRALDLYPAQTRKARLAKALLTLSYRFGLLARGGAETFSLPTQNSFLASLARTASLPAGQIPTFAVLAGNPRAPGRRYVFLLFGPEANPVAVVKAGNTARARELIQHEAALLRELGGRRKALPQLRDESVCGEVAAFSTEFIAGSSPAGESSEMLASILTAWLDESHAVELSELPVWQRLLKTEATAPLPEGVITLTSQRVRPVLFHGDLAPWNVKVAAGRWTVLDWERGERLGMPGWDWLHFVLQPAILVQRAGPGKMIAVLERLFAAPEFARYAALTGIAGQEWSWTAAYLCYCLRITRQTEGADCLQPLLQAILDRTSFKPTATNQ